ncbi:hypothetical protein QQF64_026199 [Cirrhinus molitorella]|uniref:ribonuclease H n=1 Tax=Cirrhinus molitorella TaxID=172907 RepID=A0ABR3NRW4_9TELE
MFCQLWTTSLQLAGVTVFSSLDTASGFWQIPLDDASKRLTTFITPFKRYHFRRMPFGITSAPEIFQKRMSELLLNVEGVCCYMDDILVYGCTHEEHDHRLDEVLKAIHASGLKLKKKCKILVPKELGFVGHCFSKEGISPNPKSNTCPLGSGPTENSQPRENRGYKLESRTFATSPQSYINS